LSIRFSWSLITDHWSLCRPYGAPAILALPRPSGLPVPRPFGLG